MICPYCQTTIHANWMSWQTFHVQPLAIAPDYQNFEPRVAACPACKKHIVALNVQEDFQANEEGGVGTREVLKIVWPRVGPRPAPPREVGEPYAQDYREACLVLNDSPKASAALSRRCLQALLRDKGGVKASNLSKEIEEAVPNLPTYLAGAVDAVRNIGNFAAHPMKSTSSGEVVDVEDGEAEWLLDVLEGLFDFYFVGPAQLAAKRAALDAKLADAGKPPLKGSP